VECPNSAILPRFKRPGVWAGIDRLKALQQRATRADLEALMGLPLKVREPRPGRSQAFFCEKSDSALHMCQHPAKDGASLARMRKHLNTFVRQMRLAIAPPPPTPGRQKCHRRRPWCARRSESWSSDLRGRAGRLKRSVSDRKRRKKRTTTLSGAPRLCVARTEVFHQRLPVGKATASPQVKRQARRFDEWPLDGLN